MRRVRAQISLPFLGRRKERRVACQIKNNITFRYSPVLRRCQRRRTTPTGDNLLKCVDFHTKPAKRTMRLTELADNAIKAAIDRNIICVRQEHGHGERVAKINSRSHGRRPANDQACPLRNDINRAAHRQRKRGLCGQRSNFRGAVTFAPTRPVADIDKAGRGGLSLLGERFKLRALLLACDDHIAVGHLLGGRIYLIGAQAGVDL